jgi:hypothetical protein
MLPFRQQRNPWIGLGLGVAVVVLMAWSDGVPSRHSAPMRRCTLASR